MPVRQFAFVLVCLGCSLSTIAPVFAAKLNFMTNLNGTSAFPPNASFATGRADFSYDTDTETLSYAVTHRDLTGTPIKATFFGPGKYGRPDNPLIEITEDLGSPLGGTSDLSVDHARELLAGEWAFTIHTTLYPEGEISGRIEPSRGNQMMGNQQLQKQPGDDDTLSR